MSSGKGEVPTLVELIVTLSINILPLNQYFQRLKKIFFLCNCRCVTLDIVSFGEGEVPTLLEFRSAGTNEDGRDSCQPILKDFVKLCF